MKSKRRVYDKKSPEMKRTGLSKGVLVMKNKLERNKYKGIEYKSQGKNKRRYTKLRRGGVCTGVKACNGKKQKYKDKNEKVGYKDKGEGIRGKPGASYESFSGVFEDNLCLFSEMASKINLRQSIQKKTWRILTISKELPQDSQFR